MPVGPSPFWIGRSDKVDAKEFKVHMLIVNIWKI
jgi:hypothetical protein